MVHHCSFLTVSSLTYLPPFHPSFSLIPPPLFYQLWSLRGTELHTLHNGSGILPFGNHPVFSHDGWLIAAVVEDSKTTMVQCDCVVSVCRSITPPPLLSLSLSLSLSLPLCLQVWEVFSGQCLHTLHHSCEVLSIDLSPDDEQLVVGYENGDVKVCLLPAEERLAVQTFCHFKHLGLSLSHTHTHTHTHLVHVDVVTGG